MSEDLIRRSDAIKALDANFTIKGKENMQTVLNYLELVRTRIENAPSIDIVRCKECRNYYNQYGDSTCMLHTDWSVNADDFCSYGVRKTNTTVEEKTTPIRDYMVHGEREGE